MNLSTFISDNMQQLVAEWEAFAATLLPAAEAMTPMALRDHFRDILDQIAFETDSSETQSEQGAMSASVGRQSAAALHGTLRHAAGFELHQVGTEFCTLRANVLRRWTAQGFDLNEGAFHQMMRFNAAIDRAMSESLGRYAEELERSRNKFLAILGHDLRTPLGAIIMTSQYLATPGISSERMAEAADRLSRSAAAMSAMIKDLLEFTRSRLGEGIPVSPAPADLAHVCALALNEIHTAYPSRRFNLQTSGPLDCVADGERIRQVLWNLLSNAVQHGGRDLPIDVIANGEATCITVQVKNHGPAISADALQVIFDPMIHVGRDDEDGYSMPPANLGLGLFIAREIVCAHRGEISAASSDDEGTTFAFTLPRGA
ncbi:sensor histidine kinase [Noviherbaspirillum saxi]|uniref:sensor histidine kinase n=1 Tax=Noviherbaspirillum saxi TaxID=2320863 RepID=UPI00131484CD|nr:HAMP domain-containing sensor histidine kinase [Noviherbaspirillum saxi]